MHLRAARTNGLILNEIRELLLQTVIYCGVPDANTGFKIAKQTLEGRTRRRVTVATNQNVGGLRLVVGEAAVGDAVLSEGGPDAVEGDLIAQLPSRRRPGSPSKRSARDGASLRARLNSVGWKSSFGIWHPVAPLCVARVSTSGTRS